MDNLLLYVAAFIMSGSNVQPENYGSFPNVEYVRNYDGDTVTVNIDGVHDIIGKEIPIRLKGIDTPEINGNCPEEISLAQTAKEFVTNHLNNATVINLNNIDRDKYFRILADMEYDGVNLASVLLNNGYAVEYSGGTKINWCEYLNNE